MSEVPGPGEGRTWRGPRPGLREKPGATEAEGGLSRTPQRYCWMEVGMLLLLDTSTSAPACTLVTFSTSTFGRCAAGEEGTREVLGRDSWERWGLGRARCHGQAGAIPRREEPGEGGESRVALSSRGREGTEELRRGQKTPSPSWVCGRKRCRAVLESVRAAGGAASKGTVAHSVPESWRAAAAGRACSTSFFPRPAAPKRQPLDRFMV